MNKQSCIQTLRGILFLMGLMPLLTGCGVASVTSSGDQKRPSPPGKPDDKSPLLIVDYFMQHTAYFRGSCDGSGGAALDKDHFAVVNDETSHLLIYKRQNPPKAASAAKARPILDPNSIFWLRFPTSRSSTCSGSQFQIGPREIRKIGS